MSPPTAQEAKAVIDLAEGGSPLSPEQAMVLVNLVYSIMTPDHTWWRPPPMVEGQILLACNGNTITPPMVFKNRHEIEFFLDMNQTTCWLPIPKPPGLTA